MLNSVVFRNPATVDAAEICRLVRESGVLDKNSCYAYLLICRDFADTCVVADHDGAVVGFVTAYIPPNRPDVVFVWQIAVAAHAQRNGLGKRLLKSLLSLPRCLGLRFLEATVTPSNQPSRQLFKSLAEDLGVPFNVGRGFAPADFRDDQHEAEELIRIGPVRHQP